MRSEWTSKDMLSHVFAALTKPNRLACQVSEVTGLRIGDVLRLKPEHLMSKNGRFTIKEEKTGKARRVYLPGWLRASLLRQCGKFWVFEGRCDIKKHRTRQAIFKDLRRAARAFRCVEHISPHSMRKIYAVEMYHRHGKNLAKVQSLLNHSDEAVTMIYAMADVLTNRNLMP